MRRSNSRKNRRSTSAYRYCRNYALCGLLASLTSSWLPLCGTVVELHSAEAARWEVDKRLDVAPVWSGHRVRFALLTDGQWQFAAFYDQDRQMTVASRDLSSDEWTFVKLETTLGWDSHNSVTMALDKLGHLHLSGNMHCVPLIYFRTARPYDITSFGRVTSMVGRNEQRCTYPVFLRGTDGELIFVYRDGGSGNGSRFWNIYDTKTKTWRRLFDKPFFSGQGKMNAYFVGPVCDGQGVFHMCWVWRDTPDCATNHDLSYVRSKDLIRWETSEGKRLELPITIDTGEIVDPVPAGGGMINGNTKLGFDARGRVVIGYHKYDANGNTQIYNARRERDGWKIYQSTDWDYRWDFQGGGSIRFQVGLGPVTVGSDGTLTQRHSCSKYGGGQWVLDPDTLRATEKTQAEEILPREIGRVRSEHPGMGVRTASDLGASGNSNRRYLLRWESRGSNRDRPFLGEPPKPSMLQLYELRKVR